MASDLPVDSFRAKLEKLRAGFIERLAADAAEFEALAERLCGPEADEYDRESVKRMAHRLAGASGTFGFQDLSQPAAAVEDLASSDCDNAELGRCTHALARLILSSVPSPVTSAAEDDPGEPDDGPRTMKRLLG